MRDTKIEWADHTFNPWMGCTAISPGCDHCYAEARMDKRLHRVQWGAGKPRVRTSPAYWREPLKWNAEAERDGTRPRVFCASLADVFDNEVPEAWRQDLFTLIQDTPCLDWLLLTKRIGNAHAMLDNIMLGLCGWGDGPPWSNVWIGATVVNQAEADRDVPKLLQVPAARRFLSIEPMLGPIDLVQAGALWFEVGNAHPLQRIINQREAAGFYEGEPLIDWVICGGESGPHARPMHPNWARSLRDQCNAAGVSFHFKQWGEWCPTWGDESRARLAVCQHTGDHFPVAPNERPRQFDLLDRAMMHQLGKKAAGRLLDGRTWDEVPS